MNGYYPTISLYPMFHPLVPYFGDEPHIVRHRPWPWLEKWKMVILPVGFYQPNNEIMEICSWVYKKVLYICRYISSTYIYNIKVIIIPHVGCCESWPG
jgi:hypothetical protein